MMWLNFKKLCSENGSIIEGVIYDVYRSLLLENNNAIDGGAHLAYHTNRIAKCIPQGKVIGIEANPDVYSQLEKRCNLPNIILENAALTIKNEQVLFHTSSNHPGRSGLNRLWDKLDKSVVYNEPTEVRGITIDSLVSKYQLPSLDFIKLDLEGGEIPAIIGGEESIKRYKPIIVSEYSLQALQLHGFTIVDFVKYLEKIGYVAYAPNEEKISETSPCPFWYIFLIPLHRQNEVIQEIRKAMKPYL